LSNQDAYLCYCLSVTDGEFRHVIWNHPELSFTAACAHLNVGTKCTACLLNAESSYYAARRKKPEGFVDGTRRKGRRRTLQVADFYAVADSIAPRIGVLTREVTPVFAGPGITTTMTIANSVSSTIGPQSARFRGVIRTYNAKGRCTCSRDFEIEPGARADILVSDMIGDDLDASGFTIGSCWVERKSRGPGYRGSIRGHFAVRTPVATTAVHAQSPQNPGSRSFMTSQSNPDEDQFLSIVNCGNQNSRFGVNLSLLDGPDAVEFVADVPGRGSALIPLQKIGESSRYHIQVGSITADQRARYHLLIRNEGGLRLSLDHV
jgi:bacterioferritin-associated ferredoxin